MQDKVEDCDAPRTTLVGLRVQDRPGGETVEVRVTVPVKLFVGATVTVEVAAVPALTVALVGMAVTVKSVTVTVTLAE